MPTVKKCVKGCLWLVAAAITSPVVIWVKVLSLSGGDSAFQGASQFLSLLPGVSGVWLRQAFYYMVIDAPWPGPRISFATTLAQRDTKFGRDVYVGSACNLGRCRVGDRTLIGTGVYVASARAHDFEDANRPIAEQGGDIRQVMIGKDCWIGNAAIVMADLADGVVIGAGTVVVKPCQSNGVYVGNPAKLIKSRQSAPKLPST